MNFLDDKGRQFKFVQNEDRSISQQHTQHLLLGASIEEEKEQVFGGDSEGQLLGQDRGCGRTAVHAHPNLSHASR